VYIWARSAEVFYFSRSGELNFHVWFLATKWHWRGACFGFLTCLTFEFWRRVKGREWERDKGGLYRLSTPGIIQNNTNMHILSI
jgi:hypothetical protein